MFFAKGNIIFVKKTKFLRTAFLSFAIAEIHLPQMVAEQINFQSSLIFYIFVG